MNLLRTVFSKPSTRRSSENSNARQDVKQSASSSPVLNESFLLNLNFAVIKWIHPDYEDAADASYRSFADILFHVWPLCIDSKQLCAIWDTEKDAHSHKIRHTCLRLYHLYKDEAFLSLSTQITRCVHKQIDKSPSASPDLTPTLGGDGLDPLPVDPRRSFPTRHRTVGTDGRPERSRT
jgi:hypothetical protein